MSYFCTSFKKSGALLDIKRPIIRPKRPKTELKISITRILTNLTLELVPLKENKLK